MVMQLVEQHVIKRTDPRFAVIDRAAFASKNLYNAALYVTRQAFIHEGHVVTYEDVARDLKTHAEYRALPAKVAQWVLRQVALAWTSYFAACQAWQADPTQVLGPPKLPKYLPKQGRNLLTYTEQAISRAPKNRGYIVPSGLGIRVEMRQTSIDQARIVPRIGFYVVEVIYEREPAPAAVDPARHAGVDIGLNNLALLASDKASFVPRLVNGRPVKSINQFYNKRRAQLQRQLGTAGEAYRSRRLERLTTRRTRRIDHYLHAASRRLMDLLVAEGIGTLCIGKNPLWKQEVSLGKRNNQNSVSVPHVRFIAMLAYKAELVGIQVQITEESYTSKASFLDADPLPAVGSAEAPSLSGRRVKRGLYRTADGRHINADVNGAYNIIRKIAPDAFAQGSRGCVVHPVRLAV
jgi:IS605 OrfB family transposase